MLHNGLEFCKALMKLNVITNTNHTDDEIEHRLAQIYIDIRNIEEILHHDLSFRGLLLP